MVSILCCHQSDYFGGQLLFSYQQSQCTMQRGIASFIDWLYFFKLGVNFLATLGCLPLGALYEACYS